MGAEFDAKAINQHGWRQGAVLGPGLVQEASRRCPTDLHLAATDWLIVTSHDCDIVSRALDKEPTVELLRAAVVQRPGPDKQQAGGRNPRRLQLVVEDGSGIVLCCSVHDRWTFPRELLASEAPARHLPIKERRLIAEWLAKRYIRAAFPTNFDERWRPKHKPWTALLEKLSPSVRAVYIRLSTFDELAPEVPYQCHFIIEVPKKIVGGDGWATRREEISREVESFWERCKPGILCRGVEVRGSDDITLADIELYLRFDADWVSFADDSDTTPAIIDMRL